MNKLFLTFDVEDFINDRSLNMLTKILRLLNNYNLKAIFFITGHMVEKLNRYPQILDSFEPHEIGYHSTSHSIRPNIFEYTDLESYPEAYLTSLKREVAHINPLSGEIEGRGGIELLRDSFPQKKIEAFRSPGFSWSPPHLEALRSLGFKYDFSADLSKIPVYYKGITFYPYPVLIDAMNYKKLLKSILREKVTVLDYHPNFFAYKEWWDRPFFSNRRPYELVKSLPRKWEQTKKMFLRFEALLGVIKFLQKTKIVEVTANLCEYKNSLDTSKIDFEKIFQKIILWPTTQFDYQPKFLRLHLLTFFDLKEKETRLCAHEINKNIYKRHI